MNNNNFSSSCNSYFGYYFSSGMAVSEPVFSSEAHGDLYNAASRVVIDGGRKFLAKAAMAGMLAQNFCIPANAEEYNDQSVAAGATSTVAAGDSWTNTVLSSGTNGVASAVLNVSGRTVATVANAYAIEYVYSGGVASGTVISGGSQILLGGDTMLTTVSNGIQHIRSNGVASSAVIYAGGSQYVGWAADGGTSGRAGYTTISGGRQVLVSGYVFGTTILNDGVQEISNGSARLTSVCSGTQNVSSGGTADEAQIYDGGSQNVFYGGLAAYTTVNSGGRQYIHYGGSSLYGTVRNGGIQHIMSGTATSVAIYGSQTIYQSGIAENNFVYDAVQDISSGGLARNTNIEWRGSQIISSGGRAENAVITNYAGSQTILNGGIASGTEVFEGLQEIQTGGSAINTLLHGSQTISGTGAAAASTNISSGGVQSVLFAGSAADTVIYGGGIQIVSAGGTSIDSVISSGGVQRVNSEAAASGTVINGGGALQAFQATLYGNTVLNAGGNISIERTDPGTPGTLTISDLSGNGGAIEMTVSMETPSDSDKVIINGTYDGNAVLNINAADKGQISGDGIQIVHYDDPSAANGTFVANMDKLNTGWYEYGLEQGGSDPGTEKDYFLRSTTKESPIAKAISDAPQMVGAGIAASLNSLQKRLGDLRSMGSGESKHGTWARAYHKGMTIKGKDDTDMDITGFEAGYDFHIGGSASNSGEGMYLGAMAGTADISGIKNDSDTSGSGSTFLGGVYGTYIAANGWFADFTARFGTNEMDMTVKSLGMKPERSFYSVSIEAGKKIPAASMGENFALEPKAELQYTGIGSASTDVKNGEGKAEFDGASYVNAIASLNASYTFTRSNGLAVSPYTEISYQQTVSGEETVKYDGHSSKTDMTGGVFEARAGLNMQLTNNLYWHAALSFETGSKQESLGGDAGIRYMFGK